MAAFANPGGYLFEHGCFGLIDPCALGCPAIGHHIQQAVAVDIDEPCPLVLPVGGHQRLRRYVPVVLNPSTGGIDPGIGGCGIVLDDIHPTVAVGINEHHAFRNRIVLLQHDWGDKISIRVRCPARSCVEIGSVGYGSSSQLVVEQKIGQPVAVHILQLHPCAFLVIVYKLVGRVIGADYNT